MREHRIGLQRGGLGHSGRHRRGLLGNIAGFVAHKHQVRAHATRPHGRAAPSGQTGGRHDEKSGPEQSGAQSRLGFGPVHGFDHHIASGKNGRDVFRGQAQIVAGILQLRLKAKQKIM